MDKNWLIRTKSNHILGPVSKEKVLELYHNGSIKPDDEVCSGNGYWFYIREEDLVERFLVGAEVQSFNPISEAKDVLTSPRPRREEKTSDDITIVGSVNLAALKKEGQGVPLVQPSPEKPLTSSAPAQKEIVSTDTKKKNDIGLEPPVPPQKPLRKQGWLKYVSLVGFLILFLLIYYRKTIMRHFFSGEVSYQGSFISVALAQEEIPAKKKSFSMTQSFLKK